MLIRLAAAKANFRAPGRLGEQNKTSRQIPCASLRFIRHPDGRVQRLNEQFVIERFAQEGHRSRRQRLLAHASVIVSRDKDDRKSAPALCQTLLHLETVKTR